MSLLFEIIVMGYLVNIFFLIITSILTIENILTMERVQVMNVVLEVEKVISESKRLNSRVEKFIQYIRIFIPFYSGFFQFEYLLYSITNDVSFIRAVIEVEKNKIQRKKNGL